MTMKNTDRVAGELLARLERCSGNRDTHAEDRVVSSLAGYVVHLLNYEPAGPAFDAEVIRMQRTVEAFLGSEQKSGGGEAWNEHEAGALYLADRADL